MSTDDATRTDAPTTNDDTAVTCDTALCNGPADAVRPTSPSDRDGAGVVPMCDRHANDRGKHSQADRDATRPVDQECDCPGCDDPVVWAELVAEHARDDDEHPAVILACDRHVDREKDMLKVGVTTE